MLNAKRGQILWQRLVKKWLRQKRGREKFVKEGENSDGETEKEVRKGNFNICPKFEGKPNRNSEILRKECTDTREYRIFVLTWNVAGLAPPSDLDMEKWLKLKEECDIYVLGFQEIVRLSAGNVLGSQDTVPAAQWNALISKTLNKIPADETRVTGSCSAPPPATAYLFRDTVISSNAELEETEKQSRLKLHKSVENPCDLRGKQRFKCLASEQMVGLFISVWVKWELQHHIRNLKVASVGRGLMRRLGNKGSISVSMFLHQTSLCFVCTHLASGEKEGDELRRSSDVSEIMKRTHFPSDSTLDFPKSILEHDQIIWFGDLNYRLALPETDMRSLIEAQDWKTLLECDQLRTGQSAGRAFHGWHELSINFPPTYKYAPNSDQYSVYENKIAEKRRAPAWCDRILSHGEGLKQLTYERGECRLSDHRPVSAIFLVHAKLKKKQKIKKSLGLATQIQVEDSSPSYFKAENGLEPNSHSYIVQ